MAANLMERLFGLVGFQTSEDDWDENGITRGRDRSALNVHTAGQFRMVVYCPTQPEEVLTIADSLLHKHAVVVNFEQTVPGIQREITDFLQGVLSVTAGESAVITERVLLFVPPAVDVNKQQIGYCEDHKVALSQ